MARIARPWYWEERTGWYVNRDGRRHRLGDHPADAPPPRKARGKWVPVPEAVAAAFHALMAAPVDAPPRPGAARLALGTLLEKYLAWCEAHREPRTYAGYLWHLQKFADHLKARKIDPHSLPATDLRPFHVTEYLDANPGWGQTYRRNAIASVKRAFKWGEEQGYVEGDPLKKLRKPMAERRDDHVSPAEWVAIRDSYEDGDPFRLFLEFAWETGARPQEVRAIEPRHVHLDRAVVLMPPKEEKTRKKWRVIRLEGRSLEIVAGLMRHAGRERLFLNRDGLPWTSDALNCRFHRLKDKLGKRYSPYLLRHGFAQRLLVGGIDHLTVAELMGHADGTQVARTYQHLGDADDHLRDVLRKANRPAAAPKGKKKRA